MSDATKRVEELAIQVADGLAVDWDEALRSAATDEDRRVVRQLQLMQTVARIHGGTGPEAFEGAETSGPPAAEAAIPATTPARETWAHLELREKLGEGSYGELHLAWDRHLDRVVALKLLKLPAVPGESDGSAIIEEGRLLAKLRHPNVVTIHGATIHGGRVGLWMEFIKGRSLEQILRAQGLMGAREAGLIGVDLCKALAAVHGTGIVHRDVKAQNVMREEGGRILLMDFGAGIETGPDPEPPDARITGTPFYMAPELLRGAPATQQSDIYSLGVLLYRLVSGRFPVEAKSWRELRRRHERGEVGLLRDARPDLPEGFVAVVERALAPDPGRRFATAGQMEQALALLSGVESSSAGGSSVATGRAAAPRAILFAVLVVAAVGVAGALLWSRQRSEGGIGRPAVRPDGSAVSSTVLDEAPAQSIPYTVAAAVYRVAANSETRERLEPGARLALGDRLTLEFKASAELHVYVVNEDEAGHSYALFPLPELDQQNPLRPDVVHVLPGARAGKPLSWTVDSPGGREHLLVLASPERLIEYEAEMSTLARPGQTAVSLPEAARIRLRGLGKLSESPAASITPSAGRLFEMAERLAAGSEVVAGVWMRRIELENPRP